MTLQALARLIVDTVLSCLDRHTFAAIPDIEIRAACLEVERLLRQESDSVLDPDDPDAAPPRP